MCLRAAGCPPTLMQLIQLHHSQSRRIVFYMISDAQRDLKLINNSSTLFNFYTSVIYQEFKRRITDQLDIKFRFDRRLYNIIKYKMKAITASFKLGYL